MKTRAWSRCVFLLVLLILGGWAPSAQAVLFSVGPRDLPSPPGNGFPVWYQDFKGLTLDLCLPKNQVQANAGVCGAIPIPNPAVSVAFPTNFPDESFYFLASANAVLDTLTADNAVLVLAVEAAFAAGAVIPGDQITFSRHRIVFDAPVGGNYTVTTPYGVFNFPNVTPGKRAVVNPIDIGIGAPGDFTGALGGTTGPFLQASATEGGAPLAPFSLAPADPSGDLFLSDGLALTTVTNSPNSTNFFRVCTDIAGGFPRPPAPFSPGTPCITVNQFSLTGRIFNGTPYVLEKAYYVRNASGDGTVNVFGLTSSTSPTASYSASGTGLTTELMTLQGTTRNLFASIPFTAGTTLPATVTVTATDPPVAPTVLSSNLVDLVIITQASYNEATQSLIIHASSSDQFAPPILTATGLGALVNGVLVVPNILAPPVSVTVTSSKGGTDTAPVTIGPPVIHVFNDFDGDGKTDLVVWRPADGNWYILGSQTGGVTVQQWGTAGDKPVHGDFDGDGKADIAVWRPSEGNWYIRNSLTGTVTVRQWGTAGDVPVPGDYDGDGKTDIAVWRPGDGNWYIIRSSDAAVVVTQWGTGTLNDIPVPGDYDGDGKTDIAVWRPAEGNWYIRNSQLGTVTVRQWGAPTDVPVHGDFDGDGKTDIAVWRSADGTWYIVGSQTGVRVQPFGLPGDLPVPGDFDGNGKTDIANWRNTDGTWYLLGLGLPGSTTLRQWGAPGDVPAP
jgi:hypothetical protein